MPKPVSGKPVTKPVVTRRGEVRRTLPKETPRWRPLLSRRETYLSALVAVAFVFLTSAMTLWARRQPLVEVDQIMTDTRVARVNVDLPDFERTEQEKRLARERAPRVYKANTGYLEKLHAAILGLPAAVAGRASLSEVDAALARDFGLTESTLAALVPYATADSQPTPEWRSYVDQFFERLYERPLIASEQWQHERTMPQAPIKLVLEDGDVLEGRSTQLVERGGETAREALGAMVAVFPETVRGPIMNRLTINAQPTFQYDGDASRIEAEEAALRVPEQTSTHERGKLMYLRGDILTNETQRIVLSESEQYLTKAKSATLWSERAGVIGIVSLITVLMAGYFAAFYRRVLGQPARLLTLAFLLGGLLAITVTTAAAIPPAMVGIATAPAILLAVILVVAYDQRFATAIAALSAAIVCVALREPIPFFMLMVTGIAVTAWRLREIRDRNRLVRAGAFTGLVLAAGAVVYSLLIRPTTFPSAWLAATVIDSVGGAVAGLGVGIFMLGVLSTIERVFDVTTGLSLVELRDPKAPLLRELQQRAPGTWNHSLQVANLAEAAAEEIGADSLLAYVGSLYHDIGKMNKPSYFVENQSDGQNRHAKLTPAMSLLIIVGHVKDGVEMAREFNLPRPLHHFIEAHHGTTLVEYFYNVAREKVEAGESNDQVEEVEYRYPGPRPRTKEVAIAMLADAVESATRSLAEPTPSRIEQLVRHLGQKRLLDNQFDDCDLTLRELRMVEDSLIKSLNAIYHTRVAYPTGEPKTQSGGGGGGTTVRDEDDIKDTRRLAMA